MAAITPTTIRISARVGDDGEEHEVGTVEVEIDWTLDPGTAEVSANLNLAKALREMADEIDPPREHETIVRDALAAHHDARTVTAPISEYRA